MLSKLYVDNFYSLVNFELNFKRLNLLAGDNGSGKSTVFDAIRLVKRFIGEGTRTTDIFSVQSLTRWQQSPLQTFELTLQLADDCYHYRLVVEHQLGTAKVRVETERLTRNQQLLLQMQPGGQLQLYRDDGSLGPNYRVDWTLSAVGAIPAGVDNTYLVTFRDALNRLLVVSPLPPLISATANGEVPTLDALASNFCAWYRTLSAEQGLAFAVTEALRDVLPGFHSFRFEKVGVDAHLCKIRFETDGQRALTEYRFDELSHGQRMLVVLYTLAQYASQLLGGCVLCLDEPDNFVALREIQPWLVSLLDAVQTEQLQVVLISHHPEVVNYVLAEPVGMWFSRQSNRPTRVRPIETTEIGISIAETMARGWFDDETKTYSLR